MCWLGKGVMPTDVSRRFSCHQSRSTHENQSTVKVTELHHLQATHALLLSRSHTLDSYSLSILCVHFFRREPMHRMQTQLGL
mmetsp:Transcript_26124/g.43178  ORF Transcript_26124/g.43178 Transcript_26124/m.43178 type:complete len:82 (+) Transcript_26124:216-461(+)